MIKYEKQIETRMNTATRDKAKNIYSHVSTAVHL